MVLSVLACATVETSLGEIEICEQCHQQGLPSFFTPQDAAAIHYQFGLEYLHRRDFVRSIDALEQALLITEKADIFAALAHAESELGRRERAIAHYRRALEIDPSHFVSRHNLQRLSNSSA
jgi:Tfp pilus assembly protein PilF